MTFSVDPEHLSNKTENDFKKSNEKTASFQFQYFMARKLQLCQRLFPFIS
jgi:hypothetical protein